MCGIAGFVGTLALGTDAQRAARLTAMCDAIRHRGPDDAGYFAAPGVALGMRRLSIIDVAGGHQPIGNEDGSIQVVFNGEIYNYRELQAELRRSGHRLATNSDTETIVHLYEEFGDAFVDHLRGMFALAVWDARRSRLLLARDRLGIKPLYYWPGPEGLAFASELKALLRLDDCPRRIDPAAVADYLALGYVPEPSSIFQGIRKVEPAHTLAWDRGRGIEARRYWTPFRPEDRTIDEVEAVRETRRLLSESVRYRLIADVPLGAFLSGGLDSSAVVAEMAQQMDRPVRTFSIGFGETDFNEAPYAAATARAIGTEHTELIVDPEIDDLIEQVVAACDEPFADSSAIPTFLVSRLARTGVTVALSGDGGDELFGGYTRYLDLARRGLALPAGVRAAVARFARGLPYGARGRNRLLEFSRAGSGRYAGMIAHALDPAEGGVASSEVLAAGCGLDAIIERWYAMTPAPDPVRQASFVDLVSYLPGDILTKVDRMSMAVSLEARVPLLDHYLVEFATSLPARLCFRDGLGKWVWRRAIEGLVPDSVLTRPKKGFGIPIRHWFRGELRHRLESLLRPDSPLLEYTDLSAARRIVREHATGRRDHSAMLWKLLVLQVWLESPSTPALHPRRHIATALAV